MVKPIIKCLICGIYKPHYGKGLCQKCYMKCYKFGSKKHRIKIKGYYAIYKPHFKYCNYLGYVYEHRYIMYLYLSIKYNRIIYLPKKYDVHHINGNILDNRIDNLQLLSKSDHGKITCKYMKENNKYRIKDKSKRFCNICKTKETKQWLNDINGNLCQLCFMMIRGFRKRFELQNK